MTTPRDELARRRLERLSKRLEIQLKATGFVIESTKSVDDVALWREAARQAGRRLGFKMQTGVSPDGSRVWRASDLWTGVFRISAQTWPLRAGPAPAE